MQSSNPLLHAIGQEAARLSNIKIKLTHLKRWNRVFLSRAADQLSFIFVFKQDVSRFKRVCHFQFDCIFIWLVIFQSAFSVSMNSKYVCFYSVGVSAICCCWSFSRLTGAEPLPMLHVRGKKKNCTWDRFRETVSDTVLETLVARVQHKFDTFDIIWSIDIIIQPRNT